MAISRVKTWSVGENLAAADLNGEFDNIVDNATAMVSPVTASFDLNGNTLIIDADGDTSIAASTDDRIDITMAGVGVGRIVTENTGMGIVFLTESSNDHTAPSANQAVLYLKDNGSGKTQLAVRFATGAVQVLATEP